MLGTRLADEGEVVLAEVFPLLGVDRLLRSAVLLLQLVEPVSSDDLVHLLVHLGQDLLEPLQHLRQPRLIRVLFARLFYNLAKQHLVPGDPESRL